MWRGVSLLSENVGMGFELLMLFVLTLGGVVFMARDFKVGLIYEFVVSGVLFVWYYQSGWNHVPALVALFLNVVLLVFSLWASVKASKEPVVGGFV